MRRVSTLSRENFSHRGTEAQRIAAAGVTPQTGGAGRVSSEERIVNIESGPIAFVLDIHDPFF
jgi:hypothetical protein